MGSALRRLALPAKLPPNPKRTGGPSGHVAIFVILPLVAEPALLRPTAPRRLRRGGKVIGIRAGVGNEIFFIKECVRAFFPCWEAEFVLRAPGIAHKGSLGTWIRFVFGDIILLNVAAQGSGWPSREILGSRVLLFSFPPDPGLAARLITQSS